MRRRELLRAASGTLIGGPLGGRTTTSGLADDPKRLASQNEPTSSGPVDTPDDAVSVRALAERMDHEYPPERIWGNGPPNGDREKIKTKPKVTYHLPTSPSGSTYVDLTYVECALDRAERLAYDLGMVNRIEDRNGTLKTDGVKDATDDDEYLAAVRNDSLVEKGLIETHRWRQDEINRGEHRSLRSVARRHREGSVHKCIWLNMKLLSLPDPLYNTRNRRARARAMGTALGRGDYDVVAACEVDRMSNARRIGNQFELYTNSKPVVDHFGPDASAPNNPVGTSGLFSMVATGGPRTIGSSGIGGKIYEQVGPDAITKGFQLVPVSTPEGGFDLFFTHLRPGGGKLANTTRGKQVAELAAWVWRRQKNKPEWPKVVVGDMNLHGKNPTEYELLDRFLYKGDFTALPQRLCGDIEQATGMDVCGKQVDLRLQDLWLTRGGPARSTLSKPETWALKRPTPGEDASNGEGTCYVDDFWDVDGEGQRIDHVFVSEPRPAHETRLDIGRLWRVPMHPDCHGTPGGESISVKDRPRLTDHTGWGFEILTSKYGN